LSVQGSLRLPCIFMGQIGDYFFTITTYTLRFLSILPLNSARADNKDDPCAKQRQQMR
jgi:hypothetical protein